MLAEAIKGLAVKAIREGQDLLAKVRDNAKKVIDYRLGSWYNN
jgi:hypothetical protein